MTDINHWQIGTHDLQIAVSFDDGRLHWATAGAASGLDTAPAPLSRLVVDGQPLRFANAHAHQRQTTDASELLEVRARSVDGALVLDQHIEVFADRPFVRISAILTNTGTTAVRVDGSAILDLAIDQAPLTLFHVEQFSWAHRRDYFSQHNAQIWPGRTPIEICMGSYPSHHCGASSCAWFALRPGIYDQDHLPPRRTPGLVVGIEFNGKSRVRAEALAASATLTSTIDDLAHVLAPGATFAVPACFLGRYDGDWDEAGYATQRFAEAHVHPPMPDDRYPWVQYNSWKYGQEIGEAQQLAVIDRCAELGIELAVVDLGWARTIGDWRPDPVKFPRGLRPLVARAHSYGMRFGVHLALAQCAADAPVAQEHPDWIIHPGVDDYFQAGSLCLGHEPCRVWLTGEIMRLIDEEQIDYIIQDGEDMVKRCPRSDHSHAPGDSNYANSVGGLDTLIGALRRERPTLVIENCEDGGCMLTFQMARTYHTTITVDNIGSYATRQGIYGASYPFSPRYSVRYMEDDPTPYTLRSVLFGGPLILMQRISEWDAAQMALTRAAIARYKQHRTLIRDAKIIHLVPPRHNVDRLGYGWDAIMAVHATARRALLMVYRAQGGPATYTVHPRGLDPELTYGVTVEDQLAGAARSGADIMEAGIPLTLAEFGAAIITLEAI